MTESISRVHVCWASTLTFDDLPEPVVDKVKGFLLIHLLGAVMGAEHPRARHVIDLIKTEEPKVDGATILGDGTRVTRNGACLANCEMMHIAGLYDSFRMITHPGPVLVSVALVNGELGNKTGRDVITALAAGYEFECRLAEDFVPSTSAHGFRPAPIFSTMGATVVAGKLLDLDEDGFVAAIAIGANCASGLNETAVSGGRERVVHEPNSARQGTYAALMASTGHITGSERVIEGDAGFYNGFAGSRNGSLSYAFTGPRQIDLASVTAGLGSTYRLLDVMFRMYPTAGFNQPVIDLMVELRHEHRIEAEQIEEVTVEMNYLETLYPSPEFPQVVDPSKARVGSIQYFAAHAAVNGGFPVVGGSPFSPSGDHPEQDERVLTFMANNVRLVGVHDQPMFSPRISVRMKSGECFAGTYPYARMTWNFDELVGRLKDCVPGIPGGQHRLDALVAAVRGTETLSSIVPLLEATGTPLRP